MTYIWTDKGWLYLAVVIDLRGRGLVDQAKDADGHRDRCTDSGMVS